MVGSRPVRYLNVPMDRLKELAIAQMKAGETVWFGSDVGQVSNRKAGILANRCPTILKQAWTFIWHKTRRVALDYAESPQGHTMVLTRLI